MYSDKITDRILAAIEAAYSVKIESDDITYMEIDNPGMLDSPVWINYGVSINDVVTPSTYSTTRLPLDQTLSTTPMPEDTLMDNGEMNIVSEWTLEQWVDYLTNDLYPIHVEDITMSHVDGVTRVVANADSLYYYGSAVLKPEVSSTIETESGYIHGLLAIMSSEEEYDTDTLVYNQALGVYEHVKSHSSIPGYNGENHTRLGIDKVIKVNKELWYVIGEFKLYDSASTSYSTMVYDPVNRTILSLNNTISKDSQAHVRSDSSTYVVSGTTVELLSDIGEVIETYDLGDDIVGSALGPLNRLVLAIDKGNHILIKDWSPYTTERLYADIRVSNTFTDDKLSGLWVDDDTGDYILRYPTITRPGKWIVNNVDVGVTKDNLSGFISLTPHGLVSSVSPIETKIPYYNGIPADNTQTQMWRVDGEYVFLYEHKLCEETWFNLMDIHGDPVSETLSLPPEYRDFNPDVITNIYGNGSYTIMGTEDGVTKVMDTDCGEPITLSDSEYFCVLEPIADISDEEYFILTQQGYLVETSTFVDLLTVE